MNKLTLGTAQLGMDYGISNKTGKPLMLESLLILESAYTHEVKSFDTAYVYGNSEEVLGTWLKNKDYKDIILTSKMPSLNKQNIQKSKLEEKIRDSINHSLRNMNVNRIDHYLIHDYGDVRYYGNEIFEVLKKIKNENIIGSYGCSIYDLDELEYASEYDIGSIQIPGNILNQRILESKLLGDLKKAGTSIFVRSAFVQGLLFMKDDEIPEMLSDVKVYIQKLRHMASEKNITVAEAALNYVRNHPNTDSVVFGVEAIKQLTEIISINKKSELKTEDIRSEFSEISSKLVDPRYWG
jgi:aryl-alcohol dehydrogenase-like predicted oxidoreductase